MSKKIDPKKEIQKKLIRKLRKTTKYVLWKQKILRRDGWTVKDKKIQVHHLIEISKLLIQLNIHTVEEAIECEDLWVENLGITLTKGEHYVLTKLLRYKYLTDGFIILIEKWLTDCKRRPRKRSEYVKS